MAPAFLCPSACGQHGDVGEILLSDCRDNSEGPNTFNHGSRSRERTYGGNPFSRASSFLPVVLARNPSSDGLTLGDSIQTMANQTKAGADFQNIPSRSHTFPLVGTRDPVSLYTRSLGYPLYGEFARFRSAYTPECFREKIRNIHATLEHASGIHTVCQDLGRHLEYYPLGDPSTSTIYTCVPFPDELPPYPDSQGPIRFLTAGRLHWTKGYPDVLKALKALQNHRVPWELTMTGQGPDEGRIRFWVDRLGLEGQVRMLEKSALKRSRVSCSPLMPICKVLFPKD